MRRSACLLALTAFALCAGELLVPARVLAPGRVWAADARREAYLAAARAFVEDHRLPGGEAVRDEDITGDFAENKLAVCDVDGDGQPELLVRFETAAMRMMMGEFVCGFDGETKELTVKLRGAPAFVYLDNGCVKVNETHDQKLGGDFWPFSIVKYEPGTGRYELAGYVDAWSEEDFPMDFTGRPFPKEIDATGDGFVYFIEAEGFKGYDEPVGAPVYEEWLSRYMSGATPIEPEWVSADAQGLEALEKQ